MKETVVPTVADQAAETPSRAQEKRGRKRRPRVFDPSKVTHNAGGTICNVPSDSFNQHGSFFSYQPPLLPAPFLPASTPNFSSLPFSYSPNIYPVHGFSDLDELLLKTRSLRAPHNPCLKGVVDSNGRGLSRSNSTRLPRNRSSFDVDVPKFDGLLSAEEIVISSPPPSSLPLPKFSLRTRQDAVAVDGGTDNICSLLRHR